MLFILLIGLSLVIILLLLSNQINEFGKLNLEIERTLREDMTENTINIQDSVFYLRDLLIESKITKKSDADSVNLLIEQLKKTEDTFDPKVRIKDIYELTEKIKTVSDKILINYKNEFDEERILFIKNYINNSISSFKEDLINLNEVIDKRNEYIENSFIDKVNFLLKIEKEPKFKL